MSIRNLVRPTRPVLVVPMLHVIFCFVVELGISDEGFKWFLPYIIDLPASELFRRITILPEFDCFIVFGTLWWYCVSLVFRLFYVLLVE